MHVIHLAGAIDCKPLVLSCASSSETCLVYFFLYKLFKIKMVGKRIVLCYRFICPQRFILFVLYKLYSLNLSILKTIRLRKSGCETL